MENYYILIGLPIDSKISGSTAAAKINCAAVNTRNDSEYLKKTIADKIANANEWDNIYRSAKQTVAEYIDFIIDIMNQKGFVRQQELDKHFNVKKQQGLDKLQLKYCRYSDNVYFNDFSSFLAERIKAKTIKINKDPTTPNDKEINKILQAAANNKIKEYKKFADYENFEKFESTLKNYGDLRTIKVEKDFYDDIQSGNIYAFLIFIASHPKSLFFKKLEYVLNKNNPRAHIKISTYEDKKVVFNSFEICKNNETFNDIITKFGENVGPNGDFINLINNYKSNLIEKNVDVTRYPEYLKVKEKVETVRDLKNLFCASIESDRFIAGDIKQKYITMLNIDENILRDICGTLKIQTALPLPDIIDFTVSVQNSAVKINWNFSSMPDTSVVVNIYRNNKFLCNVNNKERQYIDKTVITGNEYSYSIKITCGQSSNDVRPKYVKILPEVKNFKIIDEETNVKMTYNIDGNCRIIICRKENSYPDNVNDGVQINSSDIHNRFNDSNLQIGRTYYYSFFVVWSTAKECFYKCTYKPSVKWPEIKNFQVQPYENRVSLKFDLDNVFGNVTSKVYYKKGRSIANEHDGTEISKSENNIFRAENLEYDQEYYFAVFIFKTIQGVNYTKCIHQTKPYILKQLQLEKMGSEIIQGGIRLKFSDCKNKLPEHFNSAGVIKTRIGYKDFPKGIDEGESIYDISKNSDDKRNIKAYEKNYIFIPDSLIKQRTFISGFFCYDGASTPVFNYEYSRKTKIVWTKKKSGFSNSNINIVFECPDQKNFELPQIKVMIGFYGSLEIIIPAGSVKGSCKVNLSEAIDSESISKEEKSEHKKELNKKLKNGEPISISCVDPDENNIYEFNLR